MPAQRENGAPPMAIMPGASRVQKFSGNRHKRAITKIILHTTEGGSWPGYGGGGSAPHFTVHRDGTIRQHIDTSRSAKALVNRSGGVETNNGGCIQIEFIGSCDRAWARKHGLFFTEDANDTDLAGLARVLAWISKTHDIPLTATGLSWPTSNAAYRTAPQRMSYSRWNSYRGVLGHTHVPENDHWDPGAFPIDRLLRLARGGTMVPSPGTSVPVSKPAAKPAVTTDGQLVIDNRFGTSTVKAGQRFLNIRGADLKVDGKAGHEFWKALARYLDAPYVDGVVSRQSHKAESLGNGITQGWDYTGPNSKGSQLVVLLQKWIGVTADGIWGPQTSGAFQRKLNAHGVGM